MNQLYKNPSALSIAVREKKRQILERHDGRAMLISEELARELGLKNREAAQKWANERGIPPVPIGRRHGYEVDLVAMAIVQTRGAC